MGTVVDELPDDAEYQRRAEALPRLLVDEDVSDNVKIAGLIAAFPVLVRRDARTVNDVRALERNASNSRGTLAAARFILWVWEEGASFDRAVAWGDWDDQQRAAYQAWEVEPWKRGRYAANLLYRRVGDALPRERRPLSVLLDAIAAADAPAHVRKRAAALAMRRYEAGSPRATGWRR